MEQSSKNLIENPQNENKFNLGLSTLQEINEILIEIRKITINIKDNEYIIGIISQGKAQHIKYGLCKQLLVRATPILGEEISKNMNEKICKIKLGWKRPNPTSPVFNIDSNANIPEGAIEIYYPSTDIELDNFAMEIQLEMQGKGKSFMPNKGESGLF